MPDSLHLHIGQTLGHYSVSAPIGAGGMGVVYRARDLRLERDVAIKVLPAGLLADDSARKRFRKEALALSRLNHPNIATIYDFDSEAGLDFLVMEFVAGETLKQKIAAGPIAERELLPLAKQIAGALADAHEQNIVHRDLKPANILVTPKARIKVLDFGLAKLLHAGDVHTAETVTADTNPESTGISGTLPYMSPEQLLGEPIDTRSDIFSFGGVLYEMATGRRAFPENSAPRLTDSILRDPPVPPRALNSRINPELERIILKCLEKSPALRYQSAAELSVDLTRLSSPAAAATTPASAPPFAQKNLSSSRYLLWLAPLLALAILAAIFFRSSIASRFRPTPASATISSLAVLPLANLSHDPEQEYFVEGMADELTTQLAQISQLRVISRTSTMRYRTNPKPLPQIAAELGVDAVIEGSVERAGDQVRITAQLINARTDSHLWAKSYQRDLRNILVMQSEVAREIAQEIQVKLTPQESQQFAQSRPVNPAAYEARLRGLYHWNFHTPDELKIAVAEYQKALAIDPDYALAYAGLSDVYHIQPFNSDAAPDYVLPKAKETALKALQLDPNLSGAHVSLAWVLQLYEWDWAGAEREFQEAIRLAPNSSEPRAYYAQMLSLLGRHEEAIAQATKARELDPLAAPVILQYARCFLYAGQKEKAVAAFQQALQANPRFWPYFVFLGETYQQQGNYELAIETMRKGEGPTLLATSFIGHTYGLMGNKPEAKKILASLIAQSKQKYIPPTYMARISIGLGDNDAAIAWLEKAFSVHDSHLVFLAVEPTYAPLRSDPRFLNLLDRLRLPQPAH